MNGARLEVFLARIYSDPDALADFLADPAGAARRAGLSAADAEALAQIDRVGLELAAEGFARKRATWSRRCRGGRGRPGSRA